MVKTGMGSATFDTTSTVTGGTLTIAAGALNTYSGGTNINAGTLTVSGVTGTAANLQIQSLNSAIVGTTTSVNNLTVANSAASGTTLTIAANPAVAINAAQAAFDLRQEAERMERLEVEILFGVFNLHNHQVCMPVIPDAEVADENVGLAQAPTNPEEFKALAIRMAELLRTKALKPGNLA